MKIPDFFEHSVKLVALKYTSITNLPSVPLADVGDRPHIIGALK